MSLDDVSKLDCCGSCRRLLFPSPQGAPRQQQPTAPASFEVLRRHLKKLSKLFTTLMIAFFFMSFTFKAEARMRVAVAKFGATDHFTSAYGGWNIGGGLAAQLVTELIKTDRVVVVERAVLSKILIEQELGESKLLTPATSMPTGHLLGVDYLIVGEVTEFEERAWGVGGGGGLLGAKLGGQFVAAHVGVDLRVVDARTGQIIASHRSQGRAWEKAFGTKIDYKLLNFGGETFHKTPLGKATREAVSDAMTFVLSAIDKQSENYSWLAQVIDVAGEEIYLNAGSSHQITTGDRLSLYSVSKVLTDPESNQVIGLVEKKIGTAEVIEVFEKFSKARLSRASRVRVGDVVRSQAPEFQTKRPERITGYDVLE